jgi:hypothetical protein
MNWPRVVHGRLIRAMGLHRYDSDVVMPTLPEALAWAAMRTDEQLLGTRNIGRATLAKIREMSASPGTCPACGRPL